MTGLFDPPDITVITGILSTDRFQRYLDVCDGDPRRAVTLYELNTAVSESLYTPIQVLEITFRNAFCRVLTDHFGDEWYDVPGVVSNVYHHRKLCDAKIDIVVDKKPLTPGRIAASLTFGFWTAMTGRQYERTLWIPCLHKAFAKAKPIPTLKAVNRIVTPVRLLRNRIAHHEPILHWDLPKHHNNIMTLISWLSPEAAIWAKQQSRFPQVYGRGPHWPQEKDA